MTLLLSIPAALIIIVGTVIAVAVCSINARDDDPWDDIEQPGKDGWSQL